MNVIKLTPPVRTKLLLQKAHWPRGLGDCTVALVSAFKGNLVHWHFSSYCVHSSVHRDVGPATWTSARMKEAGRVLSLSQKTEEGQAEWARDEICILEDSSSSLFFPLHNRVGGSKVK